MEKSKYFKLSLSEEDTGQIKDKSKQLAIIDIALANKERDIPEYLQVDIEEKNY